MAVDELSVASVDPHRDSTETVFDSKTASLPSSTAERPSPGPLAPLCGQSVTVSDKSAYAETTLGLRPGRPRLLAEIVEVRRLRPVLTDREVNVLRTWLMTDSKLACAAELGISPATVNTHIARIRAKYVKVGRPASTKAALAVRAIQDDVIDIDAL
ncbi:helix-turn-helix transcriptional regulator [Gordonia malaquae]|uniref:helix-turn-helix transcriptional regulator n=1 Tax=Gordonia malaquae TaxID=410332 RepID=UPI003BEF1625